MHITSAAIKKRTIGLPLDKAIRTTKYFRLWRTIKDKEVYLRAYKRPGGTRIDRVRHRLLQWAAPTFIA